MSLGPLLAGLFLAAAQAPIAAPEPAPRVDFARLLEELGDRASIARFPDPPFRARVEPWRASSATREERVLFEADGPGAITRIWAAKPAGRLRVRCDGDERVVLDVDMAAFLRGDGAVPAPLASTDASGGCALFPIPFARRVVVTAIDAGTDAGVVEWRRYADDVAVGWLAHGDVESSARAILRVSAPERDLGELAYTYHLSRSAPDGELLATSPTPAVGSRAVTELRFRIDPRHLHEALRSCVLRMSFDGEPAVAAPLGLLFGTAGETSFTRVDASGEISARFVMPYRESFELAIDNEGDRDLHMSGAVRTMPWAWNERSLHFRTAWRSSGRFEQDAVTTTRITGRGVHVGTRIRVANPAIAPWDAGSSLVADGSLVASRVSARDAYGVDDCSATANWTRGRATPWRGFVREGGTQCFGEFEVYRFRALDVVPFEREIVDAHAYAPSDSDSVQRALCITYYARPGATDDAPRPVHVAHAWPGLPFQRASGAVEAEDARVASASPDVRLERSSRRDVNSLSGGKELHVLGGRAGDHVELEIPCAPGRRVIAVLAARGADLGRVRFSVDGRVALEDHDARVPEPPKEQWSRDVRGTPVESIALGTHEVASSFRLRIELLDDEPRARAAIDAVVVR